MKKFVAQGIILSHVACHNERKKTAERLNKSINEIPLKYGSVRMAVNSIQFTSNDSVETYIIDKSIDELNIREQRLILEISYKFDYQNAVDIENPIIINDHDVVTELEVGKRYSLHMLSSHVSKKHYMKLINPSCDNTIKSYFLKSWADSISFLSPPELPFTENRITPRNVINKFNLDPQLIIV